MNKFILAFLLLFIGLQSKAQSFGDSSVKNNPIFSSVEVAPKFPGGLKGFYQFIADNLKEPDTLVARFSNKIVTVKIVINKEGLIVFAEVEKGVNEQYNNAALAMIQKMPKWIAGKQNGRPVSCYVTIPVCFISG